MYHLILLLHLPVSHCMHYYPCHQTHFPIKEGYYDDVDDDDDDDNDELFLWYS